MKQNKKGFKFCPDVCTLSEEPSKGTNMSMPVLPMMLALTMVWAWTSISPNMLQAQTASRFFSEIPVFIDTRGDTIPSDPHNRPYKMIAEYPEYKVGPGDVLEIITFEGADRKAELARIRPDGTISFSIVPSVHIGDLAISEVAQKLTETLSLYIRAPQVQAFVRDYFSRSASVFGSINLSVGSEVASSTVRGPGIYALRRRITALELIMLAGGPTPDARLDQVRLTRANRTFLLNLQIAVTRGDNRHNPILEDGDVLQVTGTQQSDRRVAVLGAVSEPGVSNLSSQSNVLEAISSVGGFSPQAAPNRIRIIRADDPNNPTIITVNANRILKGDLSQNVPVLDGDIIVVPRAYGYELSELLAEISPLINFGGLIRTGPAISVSGYEWNAPGQSGGQTTAILPGGTTTTTAIPATRDLETERRILEQIQNNLQKTTDEKR